MQTLNPKDLMQKNSHINVGRENFN